MVQRATGVGSRIDFSNFPRTESAMDIRGWESLWKVFAARQFYNSLDPNCYRIYMLLGCFDCAQTYSPTSALMPTAIASLANPMSTSRWRRQSNYTKCYKLIIVGVIFILCSAYSNCSSFTVASTDMIATKRITGETR